MDVRVEPQRIGRDVACSTSVLISVLSNLVQNAIKYIGQSEVRRVLIRSAARQNDVRVEVEDTDPGRAPRSLGEAPKTNRKSSP